MKVGDKVRVTQRYQSNYAKVDDVGELVTIDAGCHVKYCVKILQGDRYHSSWCLDVEPVLLDTWGGNILKFRFP
jgi:hypothetical protein